MSEYVIKTANILLPDGFAAADIRIADDTIAEVGFDLTAPETVDAGGAFVVPGFVDIHIHGCAGGTVLEGRGGLVRMSAALAAHGVTSFVPTIEAAPPAQMRAALGAVSACAREPLPGAQALGAHLEGPFVGRAYKGALNEAYFMEPSFANYEKICGEYADTVARVTIDPSLPGAPDLIAALSRQGVLVSLGHTDASADVCDRGFAAGAALTTHLFNGMAPLHHRQPSLPGAALACDGAAVELIADLVHVDGRVLKLAARAKGTTHTALISDAMAAAGMPDGDYELGGMAVLVRGGVARIPAGNLAGSTLFLDQAVRNMTDLGFSLQEAAEMASATPAGLLGLGRGRILPGYLADLTFLDGDYAVLRTIAAGKTIYQRR